MSLKGNVKSIKMFQFKAIEKKGKIEKGKIENPEGMVHVDNQYDFNKQGMITERRKYISGELSHRFTFTYDDDLNTLNKKYFNSSGNLVAESKYENIHNESGDLIEEKEFMTGKNLNNNWTHKFFKNQNEIKRIEYIGERAYRIYEYFYDKKGNLLQENYNNPDGTIFMKTLTEYDKGYVIKVSNMDSKDNLIYVNKYKYLDFDNQNNWTTVLIGGDEKSKNIMEVEIEYYK